MPKFGATSEKRLGTCCAELQVVFRFLIRIFDCSIIEGHRSKGLQNRYFRQGKSRLKYPDGEHNERPSNAIDAAPYDTENNRILWDRNNCIYFAGVVVFVGRLFGYDIRWGGNWDQDQEIITDQGFQDLVHFELIKGK